MTRRIALFVPLGAALLLYAVSLTFGRTLDDLYHVVDPSESPKQRLSEVWQSPYWGGNQAGGLYRPVTTTTFWLEGTWHLPLAWRHGFNVVLFGAVTVLLVRLALQVGIGPWGAGVAGLLFALHPVHVEAVAGLVGRAELLAALAMLLALLLHMRRIQNPTTTGTWSLFLSITALSFLAAGAKESAWLLPLFALPLHARHRRSVLQAWPAWAGYGLGIGFHLALRHRVLGGWINAPNVVIPASDNPLVALSGLKRLTGGLSVVGENILHLVVPTHLSPDYSGTHLHVTGGWGDGRLWLGLGFFVATLLLIGWGFRSRGRGSSPAALLLSGSWLLVSGLFFMNLFLDLGTVLADRLLFWPSMAWSMLVGGVAVPIQARLKPRNSLPPLLAHLAVAFFAVFYAWGSLRYLPEWRDDKRLFTAAVRSVPESSRNWYNLGRAVEAEGRLDQALDAFRRARTLDPNDYQSWAQEAEVLIRQGQWDDARAPLTVALRIHPEDAMSKVNEGVLWLQQGWGEPTAEPDEVAGAAARFREVLAKEPDRSEALLNLALAEGRLGHVATSEASWRRYIAARPKDPQGFSNLAWLLATRTDRFQEAETLARQAVALSPSDPKLQVPLAEALFRQGKKEEAAHVAAQALTLHPTGNLETVLQQFVAKDSMRTPSTP
jgi:protein O-mannosyl-transferase